MANLECTITNSRVVLGYALFFTSLAAAVVVADAVAAAAVSSHGSDSPHMGKPQDRALLVQMWQQAATRYYSWNVCPFTMIL